MDENVLKVLREISKDKKRVAAVIVAGLALISLVAGMFSQFVIVILAIAAMVVAFFVGELEIKKFGIELVTLTVVLSGFLYGSLTGVVVGVVLMTMHFILSRNLGPYVVYCVPMMGIVGFLAGSATVSGWIGGDIATIGIALSLFYNLVTGGIGSITYNFFSELVWSGTNFALNFVLFAKFAPIILLIMA